VAVLLSFGVDFSEQSSEKQAHGCSSQWRSLILLESGALELEKVSWMIRNSTFDGEAEKSWTKAEMLM